LHCELEGEHLESDVVVKEEHVEVVTENNHIELIAATKTF
jgi:hypothetical protein